jgi:adenylate cyclase
MTKGQNIPSLKKSFKLRIQISMLVSFLLVLMITCGSIIYYDYIRTTRAFLAQVDKDIENATQTILQATITYIEPAKVMTQISAGLVQKDTNILDSSIKLVDFAIKSLTVYPQIAGFYHGDQTGNSLSISRVVPGSKFPFSVQEQLPSLAEYEVRIISRASGGIPSEYYLFKDKNGITVAVNQRPVSSEYYDPRTRPWFIDAVKARKPVWSNPYVFATSKEIGITAANPIIGTNGNVTLVLSADITMVEISTVLARTKIGKTGISFVFNNQGQVIGYPDVKKLIKKSDHGAPFLPRISDTNNPAVIGAYNIFTTKGNKNFILQNQGIDYIVRFVDISKELGYKAFIGFVAPKREFTAEAEQMTNTMVAFSVVIFILAAAMIYIISRNISAPIQRTAKELAKIGNFDIDVTTPVDSHFYEISLMHHALANTKRSLQDFGRFVPKAVVRKLIESGEGAELGGKKMNITIMFSDVENFTSISEKMTSEKMSLHLSDYFDQLTKIILEEHGTIDKYIGDSIMAFWGAPVEDNLHPLHACRAVINCSKRLQELNKTWALDGKPQFKTRFGVHTGDAVVGNVGSKDRLNYSAFGDGVNLASRLEGVNKLYHTYMLISHDTFIKVRQEIICRPIDFVAVVGRTEGVRIYELLGERSEEPHDKFGQEQMDTIAKVTTEAFDYYLHREFEKAEKAYQDLLHILPDDPVANLYIDRCQEYQKNPPAKGWRGINVLTAK